MALYNSFVRIPLLALRQRARPLPRIAMPAADTLALRVWPGDVDFNLHLNNARYLTFMDYGRVHLAAATGMLETALNQHWIPLAGSASITYRRPLACFGRFTLTSRFLCWDEKWFYIEQVFLAEQRLAAIAHVKQLFRDETGNIPPQRVVDLAQPGTQSPPIEDALTRWNGLIKDSLDAAERVRI